MRRHYLDVSSLVVAENELECRLRLRNDAVYGIRTGIVLFHSSFCFIYIIMRCPRKMNTGRNNRDTTRPLGSSCANISGRLFIDTASFATPSLTIVIKRHRNV